MKRVELIKIIVPATIVQWTVETPQYKHTGKERSLTNMFGTWAKSDLENKLVWLIEKGYVKC